MAPSTLTADEQEQVKRLYAKGHRIPVLAALFYTSERTIGRVVLNPPSEQEMADAKHDLAQVKEDLDQQVFRYAGWTGEKARRVWNLTKGENGRDAWGETPTGGDYGPGVVCADGTTVGPGSSQIDSD